MMSSMAASEGAVPDPGDDLAESVKSASSVVCPLLHGIGGFELQRRHKASPSFTSLYQARSFLLCGKDRSGYGQGFSGPFPDGRLQRKSG